jgi:threonylcarbamoyladenosine tRNA methylthiotransferase MtaB
VRGRVRSRGRDEIVSEVRGLAERGCREIVLTGINLSAYGTDLKADPEAGDLTGLISELCRIESLKRIRLSSIEPRILTADFINTMADLPKVCPHFHLSLQSGCDNTLKRMNRKYTAAEFYEAVCALREAFFNKRGAYPALTTDIIVGFPGETEEDFEDSLRMVDEAGFLKVHVFKYSKRKGTKAESMKDQVRGEVKNLRSDRLMEAGDKAAGEFFAKERGKVRTVLFEEVLKNGLVTGYTENYIRVYADASENLLNEFVKVRLDEAYEDGMKGTVIPE